MKVKYHFLVAPLCLVACSESRTESSDYEPKKLEGLEIRVLDERIRQELGFGKDDLIGGIKSDGTTVLYRAEDRDFAPADKEPPPDLETINQIRILVTGTPQSRAVASLDPSAYT